MSKPIRVSLLLVAVILLAAPALAKAAPGLVGNDEAAQSANVLVIADNVDCSKLNDDDAREKCREARHERNDDKYDNKDRDVDDVECNKFKDDDARRRCVRAKIKN